MYILWVCNFMIFFKFRCRKSGWPLCGAKCEKKVKHNPEVVVPHQTGKYTEFTLNSLSQNDLLHYTY